MKNKYRIAGIIVLGVVLVGAGIVLGIRRGHKDAESMASKTPPTEVPDWCKSFMVQSDAARLTGWTLSEPIEYSQEPILTAAGKSNCLITIKQGTDSVLILNVVPLFNDADRKNFSQAVIATRDELKKIRVVTSLGLGKDSYFTNGGQGVLSSSVSNSAYIIIYGQVPGASDAAVTTIVKKLFSYAYAHVPTQTLVSVIPTSTPTPVSRPSVLISDVPFTSQAPLGGWDDPRQQDGCEETSALMAVYWAQGKSLDAQEALREITAIADYEQVTYGSYHDTNAHDTIERIFKGYFNFSSVQEKNNITVEDIKAALYDGQIVLVPLNGQLLGNPNFSGAGPERHMLVVIGYDPKTDTFTTNDPGTRKGKGYRYSAATLQKSLLNYPTGDHLPITEHATAMIMVSK